QVGDGRAGAQFLQDLEAPVAGRGVGDPGGRVLEVAEDDGLGRAGGGAGRDDLPVPHRPLLHLGPDPAVLDALDRSEEHTSELQSHHDLVCRLLLEKKKKNTIDEQTDNTIKNFNNHTKTKKES